MSLVLMALLTATNLFSVRSFGEFEYWCASCLGPRCRRSPFIGALDRIGIPGSADVMNARGVPVKAIMATTAIGFLSTILAWLSPETVFLFLVNSSGAIAMFVYLLIAVAQLRMRRQLERDAPEKLKVKMWLYPWLTWFSIVAIVVAAAFIRSRRERQPSPTRGSSQAPRPGAA
jgi:L-asparagine transporter-like permease